MDIVFVLLPLALLFAAVALGAFIWSVRSGQYDDVDTPSVKVLVDEDE
jgi:cbb3-type cytochrome oxidase maturation protein